ncbi:MAG: M1 family metallopeptidase [Deltaproteobacteria bacterium]|nr:M1 family metallopeptidase [Deltaproteobacteria bacterium]
MPAETERTAQQVPAGPLPDGTRPTRYRLSVTIIPEQDRFSGTSTIGIELDEPSATIWMHGQGLDVTSIYATHAMARIPATWTPRTTDGVVRVDLQEPLPAGRSTLHVEYSAGFDTPLRGLYRVESAGNAYAFTQFESISARLAFPCFDEPRFKTPFEVTLTIPAGQFAAANTPIERAIELPDGLQRVSFAPTLPLPTYLVAWAVGPLDVVVGPAIGATKARPLPIPLRGIAARGQGERLRHALDRTGPFVLALENYFGIPYPYRKLDLVAVPDFAAGAMENVGLITFREWLLLLEEGRATEGQRRAFAYVLAHELAHQWFGNLVTMPWWDDIWLNEAFATWMGNKVVQKLHPEYRVDLGELASTQRAMRLDSLGSARSIRQPIETNHDIKNAFDSITYEKGGAVLAMFERWMGAEAFRDGIRLYLRRHEGGTATSADLLAALDEVSDRDVTQPFLSFLNQPGVPLVTGAADGSCDAGVRTLQLSQERYLPIGSSGDSDRIWDIPLCIRHAAGTTCTSLSSARARVDLPGCPSWWMPNADGAGYFRFSMSVEDWTRLRTQGFRELSDRGRLAVADSVEASFDRGVMDIELLLPWFSDWVESPLRQLAVAPMRPLRFLIDDASPPALRGTVTAYAGQLYRKRYRQLGWRSRPADSSDTKLLREAVIRFMVMDVRDKNGRARAARLGRRYIGYRSKPNRSVVDPQLAGLVLATAVQDGDEGLFDHLLVLLESSNDATSRSRILSALGHADTPDLSARTLDLALDPRLRVNEIRHVLRTQFRNAQTRDRAWEWLTENFDALAARFGSGELGASPWHAASFCSREAAAEVERFFEPRVAELSGGPRNLAGAVGAILLCAEKASIYAPAVELAFGSH